MSKLFTPREQILEVVSRLFVYTDDQDWEKLLKEVFADEVLFDMSSLGNEIQTLPAKEICELWEKGFIGLDAVHHLAGNFMVDLDGIVAKVFCYANAVHFKEAAEYGQTREFVGSYDLHLTQLERGWRIDGFKYNLKYMTGNVNLE